MLQNLKDNFIISTEKNKIDTATVYNFLSKESYWVKNISLNMVLKSIKGFFVLGFIKMKKAMAIFRLALQEYYLIIPLLVIWLMFLYLINTVVLV